MDLGLAGKTAIVCGASSGMGLAISEALAAEGVNVAMFARRRDALEREAERLGALAVRGDLTVPADLRRLVKNTVNAFGGIDGLYIGVPVRLGAKGIEEIVQLKLSAEERRALKASAAAVREVVDVLVHR